MKYDLIVISGNSLDSSPSLVLSFEDSIYIFNIPDQTQRLFREKKVKIGKLKHAFFTSLHSKCIGGFYGLLITAFDLKSSNISISAPKGLNLVLDSYHSLHSQENLRPTIVNSYFDDNITVKEHHLLVSIAYEVKMREIPGKFLVQKAKALGIPPGPVYREFTEGKSVTLSDGRVIHPSEVLGDPTPGETILFIDCYSHEEVKLLPSSFDSVDFVVHFTSIEIMLSPEYLAHFDTSKRAICFIPSQSVTFTSIALLYTSIISLYPTLFSPLVINSKAYNAKGLEYMTIGFPGLSYLFSPPEKKSFIYPEPETETISENEELPLPIFDSFMVTFLGTGSMYPSKYRNVAGILIHAKSGFILFDSGEGTVGQLRRRFGKKNSEIILKNLLLIFVSHNHGDHQFGLYQLLQERAKTTNVPVPLICHETLNNHLQEIENNSGFGSLCFAHSSDTCFETGTIKLETIPVVHCRGSKACVLTVDGGYRIAYSGDRGFNDNFPEIVSACDLMIHEATFSDDLSKLAEEKRHSTMSQAVATGQRANAQFLILTHFSQRYPKIPVFDTNSSNIGFAFDYLTIRFEEIKQFCSNCSTIFQKILELEQLE